MAQEPTLLAHLVPKLTSQVEDAATEVLAFILKISTESWTTSPAKSSRSQTWLRKLDLASAANLWLTCDSADDDQLSVVVHV